MRIIAGGQRGRWFKSVPKDLPVKPISARIKKSVFDILRPRLQGAHFLDLYAGVGAVGLEALSRGAASCLFIDKDKRCLEVIEGNLKRLGLPGGRATYGDCRQDLSWIPFRGGRAQYDLIYCDPPYRDEEDRPLDYGTESLARVAEAGLLAPDGVLMIQRSRRAKVEAPAGFEVYRVERYGDTEVEFLRKP
jgi:16S rRNA (guanine966-N2)-methyltransferase